MERLFLLFRAPLECLSLYLYALPPISDKKYDDILTHYYINFFQFIIWSKRSKKCAQFLNLSTIPFLDIPLYAILVMRQKLDDRMFCDVAFVAHIVHAIVGYIQ